MTMRFSGYFAGILIFMAGMSPALMRGQDVPESRDQTQAPGQPQTADDAAYTSISVFTRALELIRQDYVDENKISFHDLTYGAMRGMLGALDPHSQFMDPDDFKGMQDDTKSQFGGLGVVVSAKDGNLIVVTPMEDTPGFKAGLLPGDQILKINGESAEKMDLSDAIAR